MSRADLLHRPEVAVTVRPVADALQGRFARRQVFMERLFEALAPVVGPRLSFEAYAGKGVLVLVDEGTNGAFASRAAPWISGWTIQRDLTETARGVALAAVWAATESPAGMTHISHTSPTVTRANGRVRIQFFGPRGEPLPVVDVPLHENNR